MVTSSKGPAWDFVDVSYQLDLTPVSQLERIYTLESSNFPRARYSGDTLQVVGSPFTKEPDTIVTIRCEPSQYLVLGPRFRLQPHSTAQDEQVFSFFESVTPLSILIISAVKRTHVARLLVYQHDTAQITESTVNKVNSDAQSIERYLKQLFGDPALDPGVVVLSGSSGVVSTCLGSDVIVNASDLTTSQGSSPRRSLLTNRLAHELSHVWWSYSVFWADERTHLLLSEALALFLEYDAASALQDASALDERREFWDYFAHALRRAGNRAPGVSLYSIVSAASLLLDLSRSDHRDSVLHTIRDFWEVGQRAPLSLLRFIELVSGRLPSLVSLALADALLSPEPLVASARVRRSGKDGWQISLRARSRFQKRLRNRLKAIGYLKSDEPDHAPILIEAKDESALSGILSALEPKHMIFRRSARLLTIHAARLMAKIWAWSSEVAVRPARAGRSVLLLKALIALMLNLEDPAGWLGLANVLQQFPKLARRLRRNAAVRATYSGEGSLRAELE